MKTAFTHDEEIIRTPTIDNNNYTNLDEIVDEWNNFWNTHLRGEIGLFWWGEKIKELKRMLNERETKE